MPYKDPAKDKAWRDKRRKTPENKAYHREYAKTYDYQGDKHAHRKTRRLDPREMLKERIMAVRQRAKRAGYVSDITLEYLQGLYDACPCDAITKQPFDMTTAGIISIDKIDPEKGYRIGNVRLVRWHTNKAIGEWGTEKFDAMCRARIAKLNGA